MNPNDRWVIVNLVTKKNVHSASSKATAMKICKGLNQMEEANGRAKVFAVLPRSGK